ncbi:hypothetical protein IQ37_09805 [Chryseobacterium piperi]|uniref:Helix-turn-helix type 11 domain-containing protein n=1 Tax=Chryseobacterium piperi TaxID=558152 RepID=A0A086BIF3_9FLAO|nr:hypothetical protein IQ37_09805 [Chryseobacterium piperi]
MEYLKAGNNPKHKGQGKDKGFENQLKTIFQYLQHHIATASMIAEATGVPQKNICRYKRELEKAGRLWEVEKRKCKATGFKAWYLTTNFDYSPKSNQLSLF